MTHKIAVGLVVFGLLLAFCRAETQPDSGQAEVKTGDIMVTAYGCDPPPYKNGLKLVLNSMPKLQPIEIPDWIGRISKGLGTPEWRREMEDSLGKRAESIINYIYDSLGILMPDGRAYAFLDDSTGKMIINSPKFHFENMLAMGITDSLGNYIFHDIPIGRYQLVCQHNRGEANAISTYDPSHSETQDSLSDSLEKSNRNTQSSHAADQRTQIDEGFPVGDCEPSALNYIRVAPDSISIVHTNMMWISAYEAHVNEARSWPPLYMKREVSHGRKNK